MTCDEAREGGAVAMSQALDLSSVQSNIHSTLSEPGDHFVTLYTSNERQFALISSVTNIPMSVRIELTITRADGTIERPAEPPDPAWNRAFRYYRLSQLSGDVYDAYRNLYLAFETLMEQLFPRPAAERESDWIRRCFASLHAGQNLAPFAPEGHRAPNEYLYGTLYESIRCNLFHSRTAQTILPFYETDSSRLSSAYQTLLRLWRTVAGNALAVANAGAVITYQGFALAEATKFARPLSIQMTGDNSAQYANDTSVSPRNEPVYALESARYVGEVEPGIVRIEAHDSRPGVLPPINRFGVMLGEQLYVLGSLAGLALEGVDELRMHYSERLIQAEQPRTRFG